MNAYGQGSWPALLGNASFVDTSNKNLVFAMGSVTPSSSAFGLVQPITGKATDWIAVGDFNGDGKPDLAVMNFTSNSVSVLINNGNGTFTIDPKYRKV